MSRRTRENNRRDADDITRSRPLSRPVDHSETLFRTEDNRFFNPSRVVYPEILNEPFRSVHEVRKAIKQATQQVRTAALVSVRQHAPATYEAVKDTRERLVCAARKMRKEVIMAKGHGGGGHKKPRYTPDSTIKCRR